MERSTSMEPPKCPLPEVEEALGPFIKSRDEVAAIRRNLQAYLQKQLPLEDGTPLSAVNLTTPLEEDLKDPPSALSGVRKAYWKALQANQTAHAKYDALKADLEALKRPASTTTASPSSVNEAYIPLLRQKEKLRRLKVLERAYSALPTRPTESLEDQIKDQLGAQPTPPSPHPPSASTKTSPDVETKILALKKAVLTTQRRVQDQETRNLVTKASLPPSDELGNGAKIAGLQNALQELTVWMEDMLGVIADAEADTAGGGSVPPTPSTAHDTPKRKTDLDEIEAAYDRYLHSRRRLVATLSSSSEEDAREEEAHSPILPPPPPTGTSNNKTPGTASLPPTLLPHISHLVALKSHESHLLHQKSHVRRQLASSEAETAQLVRRLAGESHLVPPQAQCGGDWLEASAEAAAETERVVAERVRAGEEWSGRAKDAVDGIEGVPGVLQGLVDGK